METLLAGNAGMPETLIQYSEKYHDDSYEYR